MSEMIDRAVQRLYKNLRSQGGHVSSRGFHDGLTCLDGNFSLEDIARAVIFSLREPTPAMRDVLRPFLADERGNPVEDYECDRLIVGIIDEALK